ncbi:MAG TPA: hypothetical protein VEX18_18600, partial [Polyangiaceae bacterium]|nr:hypothetical protein [Polyangiaceae bacterium]
MSGSRQIERPDDGFHRRGALLGTKIRMSNLNRPKVPAYSTHSAQTGCALAAIFVGLPLWLGCSDDVPRSFAGSGGTDMGSMGGAVSSAGQNS